ncbi:MAG: epoxyqueuosine reductase QueH [Candidatus Omnitrophota bacterium]
MKLLLHTCCAPCLIYPLQVLAQEGIKTRGFFYNPNIHPYGEFSKRRDTVLEYAKIIRLELIAQKAAYPVEDFFRAVNLKEKSPERCTLCWALRLKETALTAKAHDFDFFSTTLLVSPYQDQEMLKKIGAGISQETGIQFFYRDFREGFRPSHQEAKAKGMYLQKYCGCIYSERERYVRCC